MSKRSLERYAWRLFLVIAASAVIVTVLIWRREQPLAEAERLLEAGDVRGGLALLDTFLARRPESDRALALKGRALAELERWDEADQVFSQVGARSPEEMQAWATALVHQRRWSEALPLLEQLLKTDADDPRTLRQAATCRFQTGRVQAALNTAAALAGIPGHEVEGLFLAGVIHRAQGDRRLAIENWARIESIAAEARGLPVPPAEFYLIYGEDLLSEGLPRTALPKLQRSLQIEEDVAVLLRLGEAWALLGHDDEAGAAWTKAIQLDADNLDARNGLAELALSRGDAEEALQRLAPLADRPDVSSSTAFLMERAHTLLGNVEQLEHWQQRTADLRKSEKRRAALRRKLREGVYYRHAP
ncbi:MAG: tetratricopeptide repeat protein [Planctomycetes bacterium]|nr:tetratricopeptide repeat protein [Planctomycetota bacterium]